ncbi:hypothetical protein CVT24_010187 [Panaeolus cyanescens]|uniref:FCP1 homology domain-containing protein n=1 Tax=Panaeolus cyanescens TaxID=181874 RepID=A0A409YPW5_9AGAR|nr:hypothetical protein CVT24_010187 [Panaeolus cyanescens]
MASYSNHNRGYSSKRRSSPVYDDYEGPSSQSSTHQRRTSPSYDAVPEDRYASKGNSYYQSNNVRSYNSNSYSNYRRRPWNEGQPSSHKNSDIYGRASRSPPPRSSHFRESQPPTTLKPPIRPRNTSPVPSIRVEPTTEYLTTADVPSKQLDDPTSSRKLLVLDLNGSLLVRSPHRKPPHIPRHMPYDPYAEPGRPRALRTVHPRPYMRAFRDYLFHDETKRWLDTMVWSSAQPHSVADMVDKAFGERKDELKAVWARDTLGLSSDQYHQKTQTTKDLAKPWAEISALRPSAAVSSRGTSVPPPPSSPVASEAAVELETDVASQSHSAHTTLLMDDSPLKAILQPFNHLCISEYTNEMRKNDLTILEIQNLKKQRAEPCDEKSGEESQQSREEDAVNANGTEVAQELSSERTKEAMTREEEKKQRRKEKKKMKQEMRRKEKEDQLLEKLQASTGDKAGSSSSTSPVESVMSMVVDGVVDESYLGYDATLLAAIGILEHVKLEDNVAAWMKSGGLTHIPGIDNLHAEWLDSHAPQSTNADESVDTALNEEKTTPAIDIAIEAEDNYKSTSGRNHTPPSHEGTPVPTKKRRVSDEHEQSPSRMAENDTTSDAQETSSASLPGAEQVAETKTDTPKQWFENPAVLAHWAQKGRDTLIKLGISVESGVVG